MFVGVIHGQSSWRRIEAAQRDSEERFRLLVDTAIDGLIMIDELGRIALFNPACEKLFGYRPDEVIGRNVNMLMPEPYRSEHDGYLHRYRGTGEKRDRKSTRLNSSH